MDSPYLGDLGYEDLEPSGRGVEALDESKVLAISNHDPQQLHPPTSRLQTRVDATARTIHDLGG